MCVLDCSLQCKSCFETHAFITAGQNRGKAALGYSEAAPAQKAFFHTNGGRLDGATLKVELSDLPIRPQHVSCSPPPRIRNGRGGDDRVRRDARSCSRPRSRSRTRMRSWSRSRSRSRSPRYTRRRDAYEPQIWRVRWKGWR